MAARPLRSGFTTGACAAAAAKGAALMLRDQCRVETVRIPLPAGFEADFTLRGQAFAEETARCFVIKDAGDDPDVTHGAEIHCRLGFAPPPAPPGSLAIRGGEGVGRVTKPGLAVAVGEWAINPVPRRMVEEAIAAVFGAGSDRPPLEAVLSIPDGEERARRTLNARLGIRGGLSILGTSGVVRPVSHRAWTDTIDVALDVALAAGCRSVVLATGRSSEAGAQAWSRNRGGEKERPPEAYVMMGDHVGYALEACHRKGVPRITVAAQFAKLVKIACGHRQTHAGVSRLDLGRLAEWGRQSGLDDRFADRLECANTARAVWEEVGPDHPLVAEVARRALHRLGQWAAGSRVELLLVGYDARTVLEWTTGTGEGSHS